MTDTNYAASLAAFSARNIDTLNVLAAQLNAVKGKLPGRFVVSKHAGAMQPEALVTIKYHENDSTEQGYTHCVNYSDRSIYGNFGGQTCPSITMVSRSGGNKNYKEYRCEGNQLKAADAKAVVAAVKRQRAKVIKNLAASVAYAEGPFYRPGTLSVEAVAHFKAILQAMGA